MYPAPATFPSNETHGAAPTDDSPDDLSRGLQTGLATKRKSECGRRRRTCHCGYYILAGNDIRSYRGHSEASSRSSLESLPRRSAY